MGADHRLGPHGAEQEDEDQLNRNCVHDPTAPIASTIHAPRGNTSVRRRADGW